MRKPKKKKYPKKPKASASVAVMQNWLRRCTEIDKENRTKESEYNKSLTLRKQISAKRQK